MGSALVVGGTGFVGRHTVAEFATAGYAVTAMSRGHRDVTFDSDDVEHATGDRRDERELRAVARQTDPDVVVDCAAFYPGDVRTATDVFADADAYVYVSSGAVYARQEIPKREDETPLHECSHADATDDSLATYGPRKAAGDREVMTAADRGVQAASVRPTVVYGPRTTTTASTEDVADSPTWAADAPGIATHHDYWIDAVDRHDRVLVPGDGTAIWHRAYVEDVARATRVVAEDGVPGEAYNVGDRTVCTLEDVIGLVADALETSVDVVHASRRELATVGLDPNDFVLYHHQLTEYPHVLDTCKLAALGWEATPVDEAMTRTVAESVASDRSGRTHDPGRDAIDRLLDELDAP